MPHNHDHDHHDHDHDHDHHHHDEPQPRGPLARAFAAVSGFASTPRGMLVSTALLATTALTTPLMATTLGAGALMLGGLYLLTKASDVMLDNAESLGSKFKISPLMLGVGLGALHSVPELLVAVQSVLSGNETIAMGNLIGANIAHVFLILGAAAAIGGGITANKGLSWKYNMLAMAGATVGFGTLLATNAFTPMAGVGMLALAGAYLGGNYFIAKKDSKTLGIEAEKLVHTHDHGDDHHHHDHDHKPIPVWQSVLWTTAGLGSLVYAAHLAVDGAARFATGAGISEAVVGTLAVALGTSLPELTTSVRAAQRGNTSLAVGNVLGCNIFNILFIGGALAAASTAVPAAFGVGTTMGLFNLAALGTSAALMTATLTANKGGIKKWQGYAALGIYGAYCATNIALGGGALPVTEPAAVHQTVQVEKTPQT